MAVSHEYKCKACEHVATVQVKIGESSTAPECPNLKEGDGTVPHTMVRSYGFTGFSMKW